MSATNGGSNPGGSVGQTGSSSSSGSSGGYGPRRRSREMALQLLFQLEFAPQGALEITPASQLLKRFVDDFGVEKDIADYGSQLFLGIVSQLKEIDSMIQAHSAHWKISRMGLVDVSVMRIAIYEMKFLEPALPPNVAINEAVEIAKKFGSTESGSFVNGILDHVARSI
jgi:N utilization substance protein B